MICSPGPSAPPDKAEGQLPKLNMSGSDVLEITKELT